MILPIISVAGYGVGIGLAVYSLVLFIANIAGYLFSSVPPWVERLHALADEGQDFVTAMISLIIIGYASTIADHISVYLTTLVVIATIIDFSIMALYALFAAVILVSFFVALIFVLPWRFFRRIARRIYMALYALWIATLSLVQFSLFDFFYKSTDIEWRVTLPHWLFSEIVQNALMIVGFVVITAVTVFGILFLANVFLIRPLDRAVRRTLDPGWDDEDRQSPPGVSQTPLNNIARFVLSRSITGLGDFFGGNSEKTVFRGSESRSWQAATDRRNLLRSQLRRDIRERSLREIVEIPPTLVESYQPRQMSEQSANARRVTLLYQLQRQESLLFGRVVDAVGCFVRSRELQSVLAVNGRGTEILLRQLNWWEKWPGEYPWVALVRTDHPREFAQFLRPLREWLGIGVRIAKPAGWTPQRRCSISGGGSGTVAGYVQTNSLAVRYALTCDHVLPKGCPQYRYRRAGNTKDHLPDAALLLEHSCVDKIESGKSIKIGSEAVLKEAKKNSTLVYRVGGYSSRLPGLIESMDGSFIDNAGDFDDFPGFVVKTKGRRYLWGWLYRPFFYRRFSDDGDSGSWVFVHDKRSGQILWLGMVLAGGKADKTETYAMRAGALMRHLQSELRTEQPLAPYLAEELLWQLKAFSQ